MTYVADTAELASALGRVLTVPTPSLLPADEARLIEAYRTDVLVGLSAIHCTLLPAAAGASGRVGVADLEREPLATLGALLARQPRGPASEVPPSERAEHMLVSDLGRAWRDAARAAFLASASASELDPSWDADPAVAWSAVAELSALAEAFAVADSDLEHLCTPHPARPPSSAGLRLAAAECARLARRGPLTPLDASASRPATPPVPMVVSRPAALAEAQRRVVAMLAGPPPAPALLAQVAVGQARACAAAARVLSAAAEARPDRATQLRAAANALGERAAGLADVAAACELTRSTDRRSGAPAVQQTGEVLRYLRRAAPEAVPVPAVLAFARAGGPVVLAIDDAVGRGLAAGRYLVPNSGDWTEAAWVPAQLLSGPPALAEATGRAAAREPSIGARLRAAGAPYRAAARDNTALADLVRSLALRAAARPPAPTPTSTKAQLPTSGLRSRQRRKGALR